MAIARHAPAKLILASRTRAKLQQVAEQITEASPGLTPHIVELNLSSQASTRKAAAEVSKLVGHIDILINNAAVVTSERCETEEGIELQFGTNHIGHFLFTSLLTPLLLAGAEHSGKTGSTRVVNTTSLGYRLSPVRFHDYSFEGKPVPPGEEPAAGIPAHMKPDPAAGRPYYVFTSYAQSKSANILHAVSLNQKLGGKGVKAFAVHPGCELSADLCSLARPLIVHIAIWTDLSRNLSPGDLKVIEGTSTFWKNQDQGVATTVVAAFDPKLTEAEYVMLSDCQLEDVATYAKDPSIAERLWQLSERLTGEHAKL